MDNVNNKSTDGEIYTYFDDTCMIPCDTIISDITNIKINITKAITQPFINLYKVILNEFGI